MHSGNDQSRQSGKLDICPSRSHQPWLTQDPLGLQCWLSEPYTQAIPIAMKISFTFIAVFADVSMNSKLLSSAYVCASYKQSHQSAKGSLPGGPSRLHALHCQHSNCWRNIVSHLGPEISSPVLDKPGTCSTSSPAWPVSHS